MGREPGAKVEDGVFPRIELGAFEDEVETGVHRAHGGNDSLRRYVHVDEGFDEAGSVLLQGLDSAYRRIGLGLAHLQGLFLSFHPDVMQVDARDSHFQMHERLARDAFDLLADCLALPNRSNRDIGYVHLPEHVRELHERNGIITHSQPP